MFRAACVIMAVPPLWWLVAMSLCFGRCWGIAFLLAFRPVLCWCVLFLFLILQHFSAVATINCVLCVYKISCASCVLCVRRWSFSHFVHTSRLRFFLCSLSVQQGSCRPSNGLLPPPWVFLCLQRLKAIQGKLGRLHGVVVSPGFGIIQSAKYFSFCA